MATKLAIGFFLKSTKEMGEDDMPHDGSEPTYELNNTFVLLSMAISSNLHD